jgi:hypothetical protein
VQPVKVTPVSPELLAGEAAELVAARPGRVRLAVDGAPPTRPRALAEAVAAELRVRGRATVVVDAADYLRPASLRLEFGRTNPDEFLDAWLDVAGLRREVLDPAAPDGNGRVLPRLWDARADRAHRDRYVTVPDDGVVVLAGALLLGRGLPFDLAVHLRMGGTALARRLPADQAWTLPAYIRYDAERGPTEEADLLVLADHPDRPAVWRK